MNLITDRGAPSLMHKFTQDQLELIIGTIAVSSYTNLVDVIGI